MYRSLKNNNNNNNNNNNALQGLSLLINLFNDLKVQWRQIMKALIL